MFNSIHSCSSKYTCNCDNNTINCYLISSFNTFDNLSHYKIQPLLSSCRVLSTDAKYLKVKTKRRSLYADNMQHSLMGLSTPMYNTHIARYLLTWVAGLSLGV